MSTTTYKTCNVAPQQLALGLEVTLQSRYPGKIRGLHRAHAVLGPKLIAEGWYFLKSRFSNSLGFGTCHTTMRSWPALFAGSFLRSSSLASSGLFCCLAATVSQRLPKMVAPSEREARVEDKSTNSSVSNLHQHFRVFRWFAPATRLQLLTKMGGLHSPWVPGKWWIERGQPHPSIAAELFACHQLHCLVRSSGWPQLLGHRSLQIPSGDGGTPDEAMSSWPPSSQDLWALAVSNLRCQWPRFQVRP